MEEEHQSILAHYLLNYEAAKLSQWEPHANTEEEPLCGGGSGVSWERKCWGNDSKSEPYVQ